MIKPFKNMPSSEEPFEFLNEDSFFSDFFLNFKCDISFEKNFRKKNPIIAPLKIYFLYLFIR